MHTGNCDGSESAEFRHGVTRQRALEILGDDAESAAATVNDAVKVPLEQDQFDALMSFVCNVGSGGPRVGASSSPAAPFSRPTTAR